MAQTYGPPPIVTDSLVLLLDAGSTASYPGSGGTWSDLSDNGNNGSISYATFSTSTGNKAIAFDGTDDWVDVGDIGDVFGTSFAVDLWIYPENLTDRQEFIGQKVNSTNWWRFGIDSSGEGGNYEIDVEVSDSRVVALNPDKSFVINKWQHIVLSRNSSDWNFYLNGALDVTASDADTIPDMAASVKIGKAVDSSYEGQMAVVRVYNRYLTAAEILQNFNAQRGRFGV